MKKPLASTLTLTLLVLGIAGIAWAGQAATPTPKVPTAEKPLAEPAPGADLASEEAEPDAITLEDLFQDPAEMGACCWAECMDQFNACRAECWPLNDPERQICLDNCSAQKNACLSNLLTRPRGGA